MPTRRYPQRLTIERREPGGDEVGTPNGAWKPLRGLWARKQDVGGREFVAALQVNAEVTTTFFCRYSACTIDDILPTDRVRLGSKIYDIRAVLGIGEEEARFVCTYHHAPT